MRIRKLLCISVLLLIIHDLILPGYTPRVNQLTCLRNLEAFSLQVQLQKMARGFKFRIKNVEGLYYLGVDQLCDYQAPDLYI